MPRFPAFLVLLLCCADPGVGAARRRSAPSRGARGAVPFRRRWAARAGDRLDRAKRPPRRRRAPGAAAHRRKSWRARCRRAGAVGALEPIRRRSGRCAAGQRRRRDARRPARQVDRHVFRGRPAQAWLRRRLEQARHRAVFGRRIQAIVRRLRRGDEAQSVPLRRARGLRADLFPAPAVRQGDRVLEARAAGESEHARCGRRHQGRRKAARRPAENAA